MNIIVLNHNYSGLPRFVSLGRRRHTGADEDLSRDIWSGVKSGPPVQFLPAKSGPLIQKLAAVGE